MEIAGPIVGVIVVASLGIGFWLFLMNLDKSRITDYVQERGGRIVSISWAPFGRGWIGEKEERIYEVVYYDKAGDQHFATCKTSLLTGVYWTEDRVSHPKSSWYDSLSSENVTRKPLIGHIPKGAEDHAEELRRLREENARLREQLAGQILSEGVMPAGKCLGCGAVIPSRSARCPNCQKALQ